MEIQLKIKSNTINEQINNEQINNEQINNEQTNNEQTNNEQTNNEQTNNEQTNNEQIITYNSTYTFILNDLSFGNIPKEKLIKILKDGRPFSHFIESWLAINFQQLKHITGCKDHDHTDIYDENIKYEQKTFTKGGCKFMPSNMIGEGRKFNKEVFEEKAKRLIYIIVSNINFPEIKIKFMSGIDLIVDYPDGKIPLKDFNKFFN